VPLTPLGFTEVVAKKLLGYLLLPAVLLTVVTALALAVRVSD
jgi:hypothetical protein